MINYNDTLKYLYDRLPMFQRVGASAYKEDLNNTIELMKALGNPEIFAKLKNKKINITKKQIVLEHLNNMREYFENDEGKG